MKTTLHRRRFLSLTASAVAGATNVAARPDDWTSLGSAAEISPTHCQFTDLQAAQTSRRFYRVRSP